jgi:hypothetical protein
MRAMCNGVVERIFLGVEDTGTNMRPTFGFSTLKQAWK